MVCFATVILAITPLYRADAAQQTVGKAAASEGAATPPQIAELTELLGDPKNRLLLTLLGDPTVQKWLEKQGLPKTAAALAQLLKLLDDLLAFITLAGPHQGLTQIVERGCVVRLGR